MMVENMTRVANFFVWLIQSLINVIWSHDVTRWSFSLMIVGIIVTLIVRYALGINNDEDKK